MADHFQRFFDSLKKVSFFDSLDQNSIALLGDQAKQMGFEAGEPVFLEQDPSRGLYWLQEGALKAVKVSTAGREQVLHLIQPGETFNEVGAFTELPNPASTIALERSKVWLVPREAIRALIRRDPEFAQLVIDVLAQRLRDSANLVEDLSLRPVAARLARLLLDEAEGDTLFRPRWYTQEELAARLGTVSDVVQRALRQLGADGLVGVERHQIRILDRAGLEELAA